MNKQNIIKTVRNIVISFGLLVLLAVGVGVGYTWYVGQQPSEVTASTEPVIEAKPERAFGEPIKPSANAEVGVSVQMLTSPVAPGENATISVKTTPTAECSIVVKYGETISKDSGLQPKKADDYGINSWTWTVDSTAPLGQWPVKVTCAYGEKSAVVQSTLQVAPKVQ